jgi:hypothetical protein
LLALFDYQCRGLVHRDLHPRFRPVSFLIAGIYQIRKLVSMAKTVLLIQPTIIPDGVAFLKARHQVVMAPDGTEDTLIRYIHENQVSAVIPRVEQVTRRIIEACPSLEVIGQPGVG